MRVAPAPAGRYGARVFRSRELLSKRMRSAGALLAIVLLGVLTAANALNAATPNNTGPSAVRAPAVSTRATGSIDHIISVRGDLYTVQRG